MFSFSALTLVPVPDDESVSSVSSQVQSNGSLSPSNVGKKTLPRKSKKLEKQLQMVNIFADLIQKVYQGKEGGFCSLCKDYLHYP